MGMMRLKLRIFWFLEGNNNVGHINLYGKTIQVSVTIKSSDFEPYRKITNYAIGKFTIFF